MNKETTHKTFRFPVPWPPAAATIATSTITAAGNNSTTNTNCRKENIVRSMCAWKRNIWICQQCRFECKFSRLFCSFVRFAIAHASSSNSNLLCTQFLGHGMYLYIKKSVIISTWICIQRTRTAFFNFFCVVKTYASKFKHPPNNVDRNELDAFMHSADLAIRDSQSRCAPMFRTW